MTTKGGECCHTCALESVLPAESTDVVAFTPDESQTECHVSICGSKVASQVLFPEQTRSSLLQLSQSVRFVLYKQMLR